MGRPALRQAMALSSAATGRPTSQAAARRQERSYQCSSSGRKKPAMPAASTPAGEEKCPAGSGEAGCGEHRGLCSLGHSWRHGGGSSAAGWELVELSEQTNCPPSTVPKGGPDQKLARAQPRRKAECSHRRCLVKDDQRQSQPDAGQDREEVSQVISPLAASPPFLGLTKSRGRMEHGAPAPSQLCSWVKARFQGQREQAPPRSQSLSSRRKVPRIRITFFESSRTSQGPVSLS